jgi:hypothetical protein
MADDGNGSSKPPAPGPRCARHGDAPAKWWCASCPAALCDVCIRQEFRAARWLTLCRRCGSTCVPLSAREPAAKSFFAELPRAFAYPLRGRGKYVIIAGVIFFALLRIPKLLAGFIPTPYAGAIVGLIVGVIACVLPAYLLDALRQSAAGEDEPPDWPEVTDWWEDLLRPAYLVIGTAALSFLPAAICRIAVFYEWLPSPALMWFFIIMGVLYFPMALIGVAMRGGFSGASPVRVLPSIARIAPTYVVACAALAGVLATRSVFERLLALPVPIVAPMASGAVSFYLLMVEMRICGLLYSHHRDRLGGLGGA